MSGRRYAAPGQSGRVDRSSYDVQQWEGVPVKPRRDKAGRAKKKREPKPPPTPEKRVQLAAVAAARALAESGYSTHYDDIRYAAIRAFAWWFGVAHGVRLPFIAITRGDSDAFYAAVQSLDCTILTPEHFGHVHETLSGWTLRGTELVSSSERRGGGVHFTPRELTRPIVSKTLEPLLRGPFSDPATILGRPLRVCDPSVGAGAFLLEAVRQLGQLLVDAGIERDLDVAKRLVAVRCCYGVDISPWAVMSAKLALTLECRADAMPSNWLDGNVKVGDGLVGLSLGQIARFHWSPDDAKRGVPDEIPELRRLLDEACELGAAASKLRTELLMEKARVR